MNMSMEFFNSVARTYTSGIVGVWNGSKPAIASYKGINAKAYMWEVAPVEDIGWKMRYWDGACPEDWSVLLSDEVSSLPYTCMLNRYYGIGISAPYRLTSMYTGTWCASLANLEPPF